MQHRSPAHPGRIEKAHDPRGALTRLAVYLKPHGWALGLALGMVVIYTVLGLMGPYLMGVAIDRFIAGRDVAGLARISSGCWSCAWEQRVPGGELDTAVVCKKRSSSCAATCSSICRNSR
jgi:ABC-type multidrug transport system fused ATPase/permease subunit